MDAFGLLEGPVGPTTGMSPWWAFVLGIVFTCAAAIAAQWVRAVRFPTVADELKRFFGKDARELPIVNRSFATNDLPNIEIAIAAYVKERQASHRVIGIRGGMPGQEPDLGDLLSSGGPFFSSRVTAPEYRDVDIDVDHQMRCLMAGMHLIRDADGPIAVRPKLERYRTGLVIEVLSASPERAARFVDAIRAHVAEQNVYRGKVLSLECASDVPGRSGFANIRFHRLAHVNREDIILPEETLRMLERNTVTFFKNADMLRRSGRSLKRGLLLHGKPGTGKTYTARWLAQCIPGITTILVSADQLQLVSECCQLARVLAPALVIFEDVDLIASERNEQRNPAYQITLHQMLNEMDGMSNNAEVMFLLTTNRPEAIERAITARPGRVDQAIEFPMPDADCRRRLLALYGRGLNMALTEEYRLLGRIDGASPAFIQELVRKAAMVAAESRSSGDAGGPLRVDDACFDLALREMILGGGQLTRDLLGFAPEAE